jgi:two-component system response regulator HydG
VSPEPLALGIAGVERAAASESPILILGEAGTGRSNLARSIHQASPRRDQVLVEIDVASLPSDLFESELFGHGEGAFTGADRTQIGKIQRADGGTAVLDHVEDLPLISQPKLLRLLSEKRFSPIGLEEMSVDVRFIAIGSNDLNARVEKGLFRRDLYHRLDILTLRLPTVSEQRDRLPEIVDRLLADLRNRLGRQTLRLTDNALGWMRDYSWPGNLREIRNVLERAAILSESATLDPAPPDEQDRPKALIQVEREEILKALSYTRGHQGKAAALLGVSRKALWQKRRRLGLP